jgi:hypothetical protein
LVGLLNAYKEKIDNKLWNDDEEIGQNGWEVNG